MRLLGVAAALDDNENYASRWLILLPQNASEAFRQPRSTFDFVNG